MKIEYLVQFSRGSGNIVTKSWMRVQGQGEQGRVITEMIGTDTAITGVQASVCAFLLYTIPAGGTSSITMELRNNTDQGNWSYVSTTGTPSACTMRLLDVT